ncbi:hypothetical protein [Actinospica robiniae]|uniref:hypothetical protein n=1 Tax=Actinospica robiniae TaxID=304901 RepID=UPI00040184A4|nr:hypothetical protein [Actinospica robiniae]
MHPKSGFSITPADFSAAAKRFAMAADVLAALAERVLIEAQDYGSHRAHADPHDQHAYADGAERAAALATECVRRLRELESNAHNVADAYQRTEDAVAGRLR